VGTRQSKRVTNSFPMSVHLASWPAGYSPVQYALDWYMLVQVTTVGDCALRVSDEHVVHVCTTRKVESACYSLGLDGYARCAVFTCVLFETLVILLVLLNCFSGLVYITRHVQMCMYYRMWITRRFFFVHGAVSHLLL